MTAPVARTVRPLAAGEVPDDRVALDFEARLVRRRRLTGMGGTEFVADLPQLADVGDDWAFELEDGRLVAVMAADEALMEVRSDTLARIAWHVGNRHTPCRIEADRLLLRRDPVLRAMLDGLGAVVTDVTGPFRPEGGAYGAGRTMGHDHGEEGHAHHHDHDHRRHHGHGHSHDDPSHGAAD
ncbi:urease accessory protein UreE [Wenxinia marina]|uniref:Urease accessory protein UreE n=1 Tax=Wenxinia marina DSM 24838 TaxID=1123501 RepID=A0A0D0P7A3_9RHOB|nr:urease accessory protein UreE [Wenxinia marina]KIQ67471.1 Urease accessory protein UreE [Wenxinia marina DSM 24838]GGL69261.1 hypothetical protein GCM10011392_24640 [Wenxinia marina]